MFNTQNETKRTKCIGHLVSFSVFKSAFGRHKVLITTKLLQEEPVFSFCIVPGLNECQCLLKAVWNTKTELKRPLGHCQILCQQRGGVGEGQTHTPMCVDGYMAMRDLSVPFTSTHQVNVIHTVPLPFTHETLDILPVSHNRESCIYP